MTEPPILADRTESEAFATQKSPSSLDSAISSDMLAVCPDGVAGVDGLSAAGVAPERAEEAPPTPAPKTIDEIVKLFRDDKPQYPTAVPVTSYPSVDDTSALQLYPGSGGPLVNQNEEKIEKISCARPDCTKSFEPSRQFVSQKYCCHVCYEDVRLVLKSLKYWYMKTKCKIVYGIYRLLHPLGSPP